VCELKKERAFLMQNLGIHPDYISYRCGQSQFHTTMKQLSYTSTRFWYVDRQGMHVASIIEKIWDKLCCVFLKTPSHTKRINTEYGFMKFLEYGVQQGFVQSPVEQKKCIDALKNVRATSPGFKFIGRAIQIMEQESYSRLHNVLHLYYNEHKKDLDHVYGEESIPCDGDDDEMTHILLGEQYLKDRQYGMAICLACEVNKVEVSLNEDRQKRLEDLACKIAVHKPSLSSDDLSSLRQLLKELYQDAVGRTDYNAALTLYEAFEGFYLLSPVEQELDTFYEAIEDDAIEDAPLSPVEQDFDIFYDAIEDGVFPSKQDFEAFIKIKIERKDYVGAHQLLKQAKSMMPLSEYREQKIHIYLLQAEKAKKCHSYQEAFEYYNHAKRYGEDVGLKEASLHFCVAKGLYDYAAAKERWYPNWQPCIEEYEQGMDLLRKQIKHKFDPNILLDKESLHTYLKACQESTQSSRGVRKCGELMSQAFCQVQKIILGAEGKQEKIQKYLPYMQNLIENFEILSSFDPKNGAYDFLMGNLVDYSSQGQAENGNYEASFYYYIEAVKKNPNNSIFLEAARNAHMQNDCKAARKACPPQNNCMAQKKQETAQKAVQVQKAVQEKEVVVVKQEKALHKDKVHNRVCAAGAKSL